MDASLTSGLSYKGTAYIKVTSGNRYWDMSINNQGTVNLGLFLAKALTGYYNVSDKPQWFNFEYEESTGVWRSLLTTYVPLTAPTYEIYQQPDGTTIGAAKFIATIQSASTRKTSIEGKRLRLSMWDNNTSKKTLATIGDSTQAVNQSLKLLYEAVSGGQDAVIEWEMFINNKGE